MTVWFAKSDYKTADYFFHQVEFIIPEKKGSGNDPWHAKSSHLCKFISSFDDWGKRLFRAEMWSICVSHFHWIIIFSQILKWHLVHFQS